MKTLFLAIVLCPSMAFSLGGSFNASNNISGQGDSRYVNVTGDTMTGGLTGTTASFSSTVAGGTTTLSGALYVGGKDGIIDSTITQAGDATFASVTSAGAITGSLTGAASLNVLKAGDTMTGQLTLNGSSLTVTGNGSFGGSSFSVGGSTLVVTNGKVSIGTVTANSPLTVAGPGFDHSGALNIFSASSAGDGETIKWTTAYDNRVMGDIYFDASGASGSSFHIRSLVGGVTADRFSVDASGVISFPSGNVGIGTTAPQSRLTVSSATTATDPIATFDGTGTGVLNSACYMVKLVNASGVAMSSGTVVVSSRAAGNLYHVNVSTVSSLLAVGVIQDVSCANGAWCNVGISGVCSVKLDSAETCPVADNLMVTSEPGRVECLSAETVPNHYFEVGHPLEADVGAGRVIKGLVHFN